MTTKPFRHKLLQRSTALIACLWTTLSPIALAKVPDKIWILEQHGEEQGDLTVMVTHDAVRVKSKLHGCELLTSAPDWQVHCYNPREKIEWIGNMSQFNGIIMINPFATPKKQETINLKEVGKGSLQGLKYTKYRTPNSSRDLLYTADEIALAPMAAEFLARLYYTPFRPGVPLFRLADKGTKNRTIQANGKWIDTNVTGDLRSGMVTRLSTTSWKQMPYRASEFAAPHGYKRIKDIIQISYNHDDKNQVNDMLNDIGFTSNTSAGDKRIGKH